MATMNLNGWDVVSMVSADFVNASIKAQGGSPTTIEYATDTIKMNAAFGPWQISTGGSVNILMFDIPLTGVTGEAASNGVMVTSFNYQSLAARVQLVMTFIDGSTAGARNLVIDSKNPPVSVVSLMDANGQPLSNSLDVAYINQALGSWLGGNLSQFNYVFASINLDPSAGSDTQWAFCKPAVVNYTYVAGTSLPNSYLGLTYNTAGNTKPGSVAQIDPSFIPPGCQAAFMLSPALFLNNFLVPSALKQFGISPDLLIVDDVQMTCKLADGAEVDLPAITNSDGTYTPQLIEFQISIQNSVISTYAKTKTLAYETWYGHATAYNVSQSWMTIGLDTSGQNLTYTNTQPSVNDHWLDKTWGFDVLQKILGIFGFVAVAVGAVLTDGADLFLLGALSGVAAGGLQWATANSDGNHQNDAPEINSLVSSLNLPVQWSNAGPFQVAIAGLYQGGFFLAGTIRPIH